VQSRVPSHIVPPKKKEGYGRSKQPEDLIESFGVKTEASEVYLALKEAHSHLETAHN
jgi:hypothetical protein